MPLDGDAKPLPKSDQLARGPRRGARRVASRERWAQIAASRQGPCWVCDKPPPSHLHHLIYRSEGGADTEGNIVPLCIGCHELVHAGARAECEILAGRIVLDDLAYAYVVEHGGEGWFERRLGVSYR